MRKKITNIELEAPHSKDRIGGFVYGARFSKDRDSSVLFACGAGRNEARVYDNDSDGSGKYRELASTPQGMDPYLSMDTSPNGKLLAMGTHTGNVYITSYDVGLDNDDENNGGLMQRKQRIARL